MKENHLHYVPPLGIELQFDKTSPNRVSLHSDIYLLTRLSEKVRERNMQDLILSRFQGVKDSLPQSLQDEMSKLKDEDKYELSDSRYAQTLADRSNRIKEYMRKIDAYSKSLKDKADKRKFESLTKEILNQQYKLYGLSET